MLVSRLFRFLRHRTRNNWSVNSFEQPLRFIHLEHSAKSKRDFTKYVEKPTHIGEIRNFLQYHRTNSVLFKKEELEAMTCGIWNEVLKAGDIVLVEKYLEMRVNSGLKLNASEILADLRKANMKPTLSVFTSFIRQSCLTGNIDETELHIRSLKKFGFNPNSLIFSLVLHGYVKAGLPNEVVAFQEKLSSIGLWPSKFGYEGLLSAYADLGDKVRFLKTLEEALATLPSVKSAEQSYSSDSMFSSLFILDMYTRLTCSLGTSNATCDEIFTKLPSMMTPNGFARDTVKILLARGYTAAAFEVFKRIYSKDTKSGYLYSLLRYAAHGGLNPESLKPFWKVAAADDASHFQSLENQTKLYFQRRISRKSNEAGEEEMYRNPREENVEETVDLFTTSSDLTSQHLSARKFDDNSISYACALLRKNIRSHSNNNNNHTPIASNTTNVYEIENKFWKEFKNQNHTPDSISDSVRAINHLFIILKDYNGLEGFFHRVISDAPGCAKHFLNRMSISALLTKQCRKNWDLLVSALKSDDIYDSSVCMTVRLMESLRPQYPELQNDIQPSWPVEVFLHRLRNDSHSRKLGRLHSIVESFCKADSPDTIYTLQQSALQYSLLFLPKTIRTILVTPYLIHGDHIIQHNRLLHTNHEFVNHFPVNLNTTATTHNNNSSIINPNRNALKHLDSLIKISASSASSTIDQVIDRTVNWLTQTVPCHLFQTITPRVDPLNSDIPIWLVVCQRLFQDDSIFQSSINWTYLALKWLEKANSDDNTNANTNNSITTSECCLNCFREWYRYAPDNATSVALLIAGLIHPVTKEWSLSILHERRDILYDIIVSDCLNQLTIDEYQNCVVDIIANCGKTNTLSIARQIYQNGFDAPTLQYIINKLPGEDSMHELASLCLAKEEWLKPMLDFVSEHYSESYLTFCNHLLNLLRIKPSHSDNLVYTVKLIKDSLDLSKLDPVNRWLMYTVGKMNNITGMPDKISLDELNSALSKHSISLNIILDDLQTAITNRNHTIVIELLKSSDEKMLDILAPFVVYSVLMQQSLPDINRLLHVAADSNEKKLLTVLCKYSQPLMKYRLCYSYQALQRHYEGQTMDWLSIAGMKYFHLEPLSIRLKTDITMESNQDYMKLSPKESIPEFAQSLVNHQNDRGTQESIMMSITRSWDMQRKLILLYNLVNLGAENLVKRVLSSLPESDKSKYYALKSISHIIRVCSKSLNDDGNDFDGNNDDNGVDVGDHRESLKTVESVINKLTRMTPEDLITVINSPHMDTLFRCWPTDYIIELISIVNKISENGISSAGSHLAGVLINRGLCDHIGELTNIIEPISPTFLSGSPRYPLTESSFLSTLEFMKTTDPEHIPDFLDNCLRVAAESPVASNKLTGLIRTMTSSMACNQDLLKSITPSTVQLIRSHFEKSDKIPDDILQTLNSILHEESNTTTTTTTINNNNNKDK